MGLSDLLDWGQLAGILLDHGVDKLGAKKCATKGHVWRNIDAYFDRADGSLEKAPDGAMQRCRRCGEERRNPEA